MILKCNLKSSKLIQLVFVLLMSNFIVSEVYARTTTCNTNPIGHAEITSPQELNNLTAPVTISLSAQKSYFGGYLSAGTCTQYAGNHSWESSDGQFSSGSSVKLTYHNAGLYKIELKVKSQTGKTASSFVSVNILEPATKPSVSLDCLSSPDTWGKTGLYNTLAVCNNLGDYIDYGKIQCKVDPRSCGLYTKAEIDKAKSAVVTTDKCKTNPGSCGLFTQAEIDKAKSTAVTTDKCKTNPGSCGLYTKAEIDKAKSTAVTTDKCKTNPRSCGLFTQAEIDKAKSTAVTTDKCKTNPRSCGLYTKAEIDKAKSAVVTTDKCKTSPHSCGLFTQAEIDAANSKNPTTDTCKTNPYACGLFAKSDIDEASSENFTKGKQVCITSPEVCGINVNTSESNVTLSNNLEMRIPLLTWNQFLNEEEKQLWADLIYVPSGDNRILFEVIDYGFH